MKTTLKIQNLKCGGCEKTIMNKLGKLLFVNNLVIDQEDHTVSFDALPNEELATVKQQLSNLGYPVVDTSNSLGKKAKSFVSCAVGRLTL